MKTRIILYLTVFLSMSCLAQLEMSRWYFGKLAGLDFNQGCPDPLTNGSLDTIEATSIMSDSEGNLLFYADAEQVYNRNHDIMENGHSILGHESSSSGALIVPFPDDPYKYYLFTADAVQFYLLLDQGIGFNYSVIDMSLNGGLGAVTIKNANLIEESSEKLTGVSIDDQYWVITHTGSDFYAYRITDGGIQAPVVSSFDPIISDFNNFRGVMKVSPNGKKLAIAHVFVEPSLMGQIWLYNFDSSSGQLTNPQLLGDEFVYYGVDFSPNSEVLYVSAKEITDFGENTGDASILQYNLNASNIRNSKFIVDTYSSSALVNLAGGLQVAIDNKLYQTAGGDRLSVIKRPNRLGNLCDYEFRRVSLGSRNTSLGLPNALQSYYDDIIEYDFLCYEDMSQFQLRTSRGVNSVNWNFGDPDSGILNVSSEMQPVHIFSNPGSYIVSAQVNFSDGSVQNYEVVVKIVVSGPLEGVTLTSCVSDDNLNDGLGVFNLFDIAEVLFEDFEEVNVETSLTFFETLEDAEDDQFPIPNPFIYENISGDQVVYVRVSPSLDCLRILPITLKTATPTIPEVLELGLCITNSTDISYEIDTTPIQELLSTIYPEEVFSLYTNFQNALSQVNPLIGFTTISSQGEVGIYYRVGSAGNCGSIGFVSLIVDMPVSFEDEVLTICSDGQSVDLTAPEHFSMYTWSSGQQGQVITVDTPGIYEVELTEAGGCTASKIFRVKAGDTLSAVFESNDFNVNNTIVVSAESSSDIILYSIDGGLSFQESNVFKNVAPNTYELVVANPDFCTIITETVVVRGAPRFFTPNRDGYNDRWHVVNAQDFIGMEIDIFDRFGKHITSLTSRSDGWDGTYNGKELATNTYWYAIRYENEVHHGYFTLVKRNL